MISLVVLLISLFALTKEKSILQINNRKILNKNEDFVCEMNGEKYSSIADAIDKASDKEIITLIKDVITEQSIHIVQKSITIQVDKSLSSCRIEKKRSGTIFNIIKGELIINDRRLLLDGKGLLSDSMLTVFEGNLTLHGVTMQGNNGETTIRGTSSKIELKETKIQNCQGPLEFSSTDVQIISSDIFQCSSSSSGSLINFRADSESKLYQLLIDDVKFENNTSSKETILKIEYNNMIKQTEAQTPIEIKNCVFKNNIGETAKAIQIITTNDYKDFEIGAIIDSTTFQYDSLDSKKILVLKANENTEIKLTNYSLIIPEVPDTYAGIEIASKGKVTLVSNKESPKAHYLISYALTKGTLKVDDPFISYFDLQDYVNFNATSSKINDVDSIYFKLLDLEKGTSIEVANATEYNFKVANRWLRIKKSIDKEISFSLNLTENFIYEFDLIEYPKNLNGSFIKLIANEEIMNNETKLYISLVDQDNEIEIREHRLTSVKFNYLNGTQREETFLYENNLIVVPGVEKLNSHLYDLDGWERGEELFMEGTIINVKGNNLSFSPKTTFKNYLIVVLISVGLILLLILSAVCLFLRKKFKKKKEEEEDLMDKNNID